MVEHASAVEVASLAVKESLEVLLRLVDREPEDRRVEREGPRGVMEVRAMAVVVGLEGPFVLVDRMVWPCSCRVWGAVCSWMMWQRVF